MCFSHKGHTGQRTQGPSVWQAWGVLCGHHRAFGRVTCLYSAGWIPSTSLLSLCVRTSLCRWIYLCTHVHFFKLKAKRNEKVAAQQPLGVQENTWGPGTSCTAMLFPAHRPFCSFPPNRAMCGTSKVWPGCVWEPHLPELSLTCLEFSSGAFYLSVPCLKPKQMSFNYFLKISVSKPDLNSVTSLSWELWLPCAAILI